MSIVGDIRSQLVAKIEELQPAFDEYNEAKDALARLDGAASAATPPAADRPTSQRRAAGTAKQTRSTVADGRPAAQKSRVARRAPKSTAKGQPALAGGARANEALRLVADKPGVTVAELADAMKIDASYLYRVMPALERAGQVTKDGKGYRPASDQLEAAQ